MSTSDDPVIFCQRCGRPGGKVYMGWFIMCSRCVKNDQDWFEQ